MKTNLRVAGFALSLLVAVFFCIPVHLGCRPSKPVRGTEIISGQTMGTSYTVRFVPGSETPGLKTIADRVDSELEAVNNQMSTYREHSEVSKFNSLRSTDWFPVSIETAQVVSLARDISQWTEGRFDVTVGPLVDLWGFGPKPAPSQIPDAQTIQNLLKRIGYDKLETRLEPPALRKLNSDLQVDLSAIAKGHGVDRVADVLDKFGLGHYFIEIGGEIRVKGRRQDGKAWQVAIEQPNYTQRQIQQIVGLTNISMATSGDYRNFHKIGSELYSHVIDPVTGMPVPSEIASATVLADDCATADGIATGLMSAGLEPALRLVEKHHWAVLLVVRRADEELETIISPEFTQIIQGNTQVAD